MNMEYYQISFFSEYYQRECWLEIDEDNERKISQKVDELLGTRNSFTVESLKIDLIDNEVSTFLVKALERGKVVFYNTKVSRIIYSPELDRLVKTYDLGRMLINSFNIDEESRLSNLDVVFNYGNDILSKLSK